MENQIEKRVKILQSNWGGEYLSIEFGDYIKSSGIISQLTPPATSQLNRIFECRNHPVGHGVFDDCLYRPAYFLGRYTL